MTAHNYQVIVQFSLNNASDLGKINFLSDIKGMKHSLEPESCLHYSKYTPNMELWVFINNGAIFDVSVTEPELTMSFSWHLTIKIHAINRDQLDILAAECLSEISRCVLSKTFSTLGREKAEGGYQVTVTDREKLERLKDFPIETKTGGKN